MQGSGQQARRGRAAFLLLVSLMFLTPLSPMAELFSTEAEAAAGTRHVYEFSDGSVEHIALYQGANPDMGATVSLPRGAYVTDVSMTFPVPLRPGGRRLLQMTGCTGFGVRRATSMTARET